METYLEGHRKRMKFVDETLRKLAEELKAQDCTVFAAKNELITFLVIDKAPLTVNISFEDLTYQWRVLRELNPSREFGSCSTIRIFNFENLPTASLLISLMEIIQHKRPKTYLKEL